VSHGDRLPAGRLVPRWGEPRGPGLVRLLAAARAWLHAALGLRSAPRRVALPRLPLALRKGELAAGYLAAQRADDHRRAGATASVAMERAITIGDWWPADIWGHRALWHFQQADMALQATRAARRIGDLRSAAGDPRSARRYYTEAIAEARDIGAEREEGLAALGLGRAEMDLGDVTTARRLAAIAEIALRRGAAPPAERQAAAELRGVERQVGKEAGA
jgi:tetratricopeptide (TPR) repeat protein